VTSFSRRIRRHVDDELSLAAAAERRGLAAQAFRHLERAHILGQASTVQHVRVHGRMLAWATRHRRPREWLGQLLRIVGAASKTAVGLVPEGNTGGADVSPFAPMPVPPDLREIIADARRGAPTPRR
jgi:hypothetical protein